MATAMAATKFSMMSTKMRVGTAALAVATAASFTPAIADAAPRLAPIAEAVGGGASLLVEPVTINAAAAADPCTGADFAIGCYAVEGAVAGTQSIVRGVVVIFGTIAYVIVAGTGAILQLVGSILPGPIGAIFTSLGNGVMVIANSIAEALRVGPYLEP